MPKIRERLGEQGAVGESVYIATPICCRSRTETFSGRLYTNVVNDDLSGCMVIITICMCVQSGEIDLTDDITTRTRTRTPSNAHRTARQQHILHPGPFGGACARTPASRLYDRRFWKNHQ